MTTTRLPRQTKETAALAPDDCYDSTYQLNMMILIKVYLREGSKEESGDEHVDDEGPELIQEDGPLGHVDRVVPATQGGKRQQIMSGGLEWEWRWREAQDDAHNDRAGGEGPATYLRAKGMKRPMHQNHTRCVARPAQNQGLPSINHHSISQQPSGSTGRSACHRRRPISSHHLSIYISTYSQLY
jgi:hypothetical protein